MHQLTLTSAPQSEPVSLTEAKAHLRETEDDQDAYIQALIVAARTHVEESIGRALISQTWKMEMDRFPSDRWGGRIVLPRPKVVSVTSVKYYDADGVQQTVSASDYTVMTGGEFNYGYIVPAYGDAWPIPKDVPDAVEVIWVAGYGGAEDVPSPIKMYMLLLIGSMYENREADAERAVIRMGFADSLLANYRMY